MQRPLMEGDPCPDCILDIMGMAFGVVLWEVLPSTSSRVSATRPKVHALPVKDDPWNPIIAGAAAGGILTLRQGIRAVVRSSLKGELMALMLKVDSWDVGNLELAISHW
ncbi:hypothetical protein GUJ93_ZPchr0013g34986 [Zizania palustris]|uniref:Uncharacterized protein n=1 Tax=Zizania palustris TaxID=103762 RepID=A0A8J6C202_ZIZPA|nr:hypothetical protein GUJ93_ZPchr0013g34986 [Zizania palustris]